GAPAEHRHSSEVWTSDTQVTAAGTAGLLSLSRPRVDCWGLYRQQVPRAAYARIVGIERHSCSPSGLRSSLEPDWHPQVAPPPSAGRLGMPRSLPPPRSDRDLRNFVASGRRDYHALVSTRHPMS